MAMIRACFRGTAFRASAQAIEVSSSSASPACQARSGGDAGLGPRVVTSVESGSVRMTTGARATASGDLGPATARGDVASVTGRRSTAVPANELVNARLVSVSARGSRRARVARTIKPADASSGLADATTSRPAGSPTGSGAATVGSSLHVGAAGAAGTVGGAAAAGGGTDCSTRSAGGAGCGCTGGGAGAGAGAGATTFERPGRNASGSR